MWKNPNRVRIFSFGVAIIVIAAFTVHDANPVAAGPITGGAGNAPFTKVGVYQGILSIIPAGSGSIMEIGNNGQDIASTGDIFMRPGETPGSNTAATKFFKRGAGQGLYIDQVLGVGNNNPLSKIVVNLGTTNNGDPNNGVSSIISNASGSAVYGAQNGGGWSGFFAGTNTKGVFVDNDSHAAYLCLNSTHSSDPQNDPTKCIKQWPTGGGGSGKITVQFQGGTVGQYDNIDFEGNVDVSDQATYAQISILNPVLNVNGSTGSYSGRLDTLAFHAGTNVTSVAVSGVGTTADITVNAATQTGPGGSLNVTGVAPGPVANLTGVTQMNFTGNAVAVTPATGSTANVAINNGISGAASRVPFFATATTLGNSDIYQGTNQVGIRVAPTQVLDVGGNIRVRDLSCASNEKLTATAGTGVLACATDLTATGVEQDLNAVLRTGNTADYAIKLDNPGNSPDFLKSGAKALIHAINLSGTSPTFGMSGAIYGESSGTTKAIWAVNKSATGWAGYFEGATGFDGPVIAGITTNIQADHSINASNNATNGFNAVTGYKNLTPQIGGGGPYSASYGSAIYGEAGGGTTTNHGNYMTETNCVAGHICAAIYGSDRTPDTNLINGTWAGYFVGNVNVVKELNVGGGITFNNVRRTSWPSAMHVIRLSDSNDMGQYLGTLISGGTSSAGNFQYCYYTGGSASACSVAVPGGSVAYELRPI